MTLETHLNSRPYCVGDFMSPSPHSIGRDQPLSVAHEKMHAAHVRHLPVLDGGKLVGLLSQRDALFVETLRDADPTQVPVEDAMSMDVYVTSPTESLVAVASTMAEHKYGCAVIMEGAKLAGIFTTVDALNALVRMAANGAGRRPHER